MALLLTISLTRVVLAMYGTRVRVTNNREIVCDNARGVHQGDPLEPLLFCLVLRHVSLGIADIFTSAEPPSTRRTLTMG
jgi:hypothetical protein